MYKIFTLQSSTSRAWQAIERTTTTNSTVKEIYRKSPSALWLSPSDAIILHSFPPHALLAWQHNHFGACYSCIINSSTGGRRQFVHLSSLLSLRTGGRRVSDQCANNTSASKKSDKTSEEQNMSMATLRSKAATYTRRGLGT